MSDEQRASASDEPVAAESPADKPDAAIDAPDPEGTGDQGSDTQRAEDRAAGDVAPGDGPDVVPSQHEQPAVPEPTEGGLDIAVTGDIFHERYIWRTMDAAPATDLPYTWPDELRSAVPTMTFREPSGAPLHEKILRVFLDQEGFTKDRGYRVKTVPDYTADGGADRDDDESSDPVFLHELAPFPRGGADKDYVWRIERSFGAVRIAREGATGNPGSTAPLAEGESMSPRSEKMKDQVQRWLTRIADAGVTRPTVIVINDRNVVDTTRGAERTRSIFRRVLDELPAKRIVESEKLKSTTNNLMILWHVRLPDFEVNSVAKLLLHDPIRQCTIPIVNYNCLRDAGVQLRFDTSYESSIRGILASLEHPLVKRFLCFPQVIVRYEYGLLHLTNANGQVTGLDIHGFNAGPYRFEHRQGMIVGTTPLLISTIIGELAHFLEDNRGQSVREFLQRSGNVTHPTILNSTPLDRALDAGLLLAGLHFYHGFGEGPPGAPNVFQPRKERGATPTDGNEGGQVDTHQFGGTLPIYQDLAKKWFGDAVKRPNPVDNRNKVIYFTSPHPDRDALIRLSIDPKAVAAYKNLIDGRGTFARFDIFKDTGFAKRSKAFKNAASERINASDFDTFLRKIVTHGLEQVLTRIPPKDREAEIPKDYRVEPSVLCPYVMFGNYVSMDSKDIDTFLAVRYLVEQYVDSKEFKRPLAIGVFGPPGSGKGFIVEEILRSISTCSFEDDLKINLSQVTHARDLAKHFHRIQDHASQTKIPIAFIDEFDSPLGNSPVGWLKSFLMPLQDGAYNEGGEVFDVSKAIFVFAGGTEPTFEKFRKKYEGMVDQKAPDFISRLRGFLDVQDIALPLITRKPWQESRPQGPGHGGTSIRRAVILRSLILKRMPQVVDRASKVAQISPAVVQAFLKVTRFVHGVRSMEALLEMARVTPSLPTFQPSALPSESQMSMHVDAKEFMEIVNGSLHINDN